MIKREKKVKSKKVANNSSKLSKRDNKTISEVEVLTGTLISGYSTSSDNDPIFNEWCRRVAVLKNGIKRLAWLKGSLKKWIEKGKQGDSKTSPHAELVRETNNLFDALREKFETGGWKHLIAKLNSDLPSNEGLTKGKYIYIYVLLSTQRSSFVRWARSYSRLTGTEQP